MEKQICNENQKTLYYNWKLNKVSDAYHLPFIFKISGNLDSKRLVDAINYLLDTYNVFKLCFIEDGDNLYYYENLKNAPTVNHIVMDNATSNIEEIVKEYKSNFFSKKFDLNNGPNVYFTLLDFKESNEAYLFVNCHHIIADAYSFYQFFSANLAIIYNTNKYPEFLTKNILSLKYKELYEYTLGNKALNNQYFEDKLARLDSLNNIKNNHKGYNTAIYDELTIDCKKTIAEYCTRNNITPFIFYLACYSILMNKILQKEQLVIGIPIANRPTKNSKIVFGYFVNTLPLVVNIDNDCTIKNLLSSLKDQIYKLIKFKNADLKSVLLNNERLVNCEQVFDNLFTYYLQELNFKLSGCEVTSIPVLRKNAQFPFSVIVEDGENRSNIQFIKESTIFEDVDLKGLYSKIVDQVLLKDPKVINDIKLLDERELGQLILSTQLPIRNCLQQEIYSENIISYFEEVAKDKEHKIACKFEDKYLTYGTLLKQANFFANKILNRLCNEKAQEVILLLPIGLNQIIGIFSTLCANKTYVPVDPNIPIDRIKYILKDTNAQLIITNKDIASSLELKKENTLILDDDMSKDNLDGELQQVLNRNSEDVAYIIYTSGTTGTPKGVMVTHKNVLSLIESTRSLFSFNEDDNWSMLHSYSFDFSVWEIFGALLNGCTLTIAPDKIRRSHEQFWNFIQDNNVTILSQTPSYFMQLTKYAIMDKSDTCLKTVVFGGEKLNFKSLNSWLNKFSLDRIELINMYGITETTVHVTFYKLNVEDIKKGRSIIGKAIPFWNILITDSIGNPLPKGIVGEICVFGQGVSKGYLHREELTKEKFQEMDIPSKGKVLVYKSGDLGFITNDNQIEYVGRKDRQVKVRGFRIETKEIESVMLEHDCCNMAAVKVINFGQNDDRIVGYFTSNNEELDEKTLKLFISKKLPQYMIPFYLIKLDKFPLTINGKTNYEKLEIPVFENVEADYAVLEEDSLDSAITKIACKVLKIDKINMDENFFDLGGNSLLMNSLIYNINSILDGRNISKKLHVIDIYQYPTINKIIDYIKNK